MSGGPSDWSLILHGGAKEIAPEQRDANRAGCLAAIRAGEAILRRGGRALDAAEAVIRALEDDPIFNAGYGSVLNADGEVEMDAALMDGRTLDIGGVAAVQGVRHPVSVARLMMRERPILLVGEGARRFAAERGAELCDPRDMISPKQMASEARSAHDTVGCVARDCHGDIVAGNSTGGLRNTVPGRVGDSPLPGCGFYADNGLGGVAFSGEGEAIARTMQAARVMHGVETMSMQAALDHALTFLPRVGGDGGGIALDRNGRVAWAHNSPHFAIAFVTGAMDEPRACLTRDEYQDEGARKNA